MSAAERTRVLDQIERLLRVEIYEQFAELYAAAVSSIEIHPEQVNNELRNFITHLSRAVSADTYAAAERELDKAVSHVERAKRDVIKIAVVVLRDNIERVCWKIRQVTGTVDPAFLVRRDGIRKRRKELLKQESQGKLSLNDFVQLFIETDKLHDDLHNVLGDVGQVRSALRYWWYGFRRRAIGVVIGIVVGILGCIGYAVLVPDGAALGRSARHLLHLPAPAPSAANMPANLAKLGAKTP